MRYEGFGPKNIAVIVEALTDNKNRTASKIRTIFQKNGGSLGSSGSASHNFKQIGVIKIPKNEISEEKILDIAIDAGAEECHSDNEFHEIHCEKNKIYEVKKKLEMTVKNFISTEIEWIPINNVIISKDIFDEISDFLDSLDNDDDVQNIFTNLKIGSN
jgi:YebC/PmpR family DNA-binding regulatory protein